MTRSLYAILFLAACLLLCPLVSWGAARAQTPVPSEAAAGPETDDNEDDEIELERTIDLEATLVGVEDLPREGRAIARFRVVDEEYGGALFSFSYDYSLPVRLLSWDMHNESGYRRIGGAHVAELPLGQWDYLLLPGSHDPVGTVYVTLLQYDLNQDEEERRWHFKELVSIAVTPRILLEPAEDPGLSP